MEAPGACRAVVGSDRGEAPYSLVAEAPCWGVRRVGRGKDPSHGELAVRGWIPAASHPAKLHPPASRLPPPWTLTVAKPVAPSASTAGAPLPTPAIPRRPAGLPRVAWPGPVASRSEIPSCRLASSRRVVLRDPMARRSRSSRVAAAPIGDTSTRFIDRAPRSSRETARLPVTARRSPAGGPSTEHRGPPRSMPAIAHAPARPHAATVAGGEVRVPPTARPTPSLSIRRRA